MYGKEGVEKAFGQKFSEKEKINFAKSTKAVKELFEAARKIG